MRAIILAAGRGKRMGDLTKNHPKALLKLHNKPLIEWQMNAIQLSGITKIAIVNGYKSEVFTYPVTYFHNARWHETNMLTTMMCASDWLEKDTCVISYSDIVYHPEAIQKLINVPGDIGITYDPNWLDLWRMRFDDPLSDAEIFKYDHHHLIDIGGRTNDLADIQGQYMGLLKITSAGWQMIKSILKQSANEIIDRMDMTMLLKLMLNKHFQITVSAIDSPWCEIDAESDYALCQDIFELAI